jgi:hypothetical protein
MLNKDGKTEERFHRSGGPSGNVQLLKDEITEPEVAAPGILAPHSR